MEGIVHEYIPFDCPIINKLAVGRELTKIYNIMYNIYSIHLAFISFIYVTGMGSITFSVEQIGDVLKKKGRRQMQKYKTAEYLFYYLGYIMIVCCVIWLKDQYKIAGN